MSKVCTAKPGTICSASTGVCDRTTYGSGELTSHGYWKIPCKYHARLAEIRDSKPDGTYWPIPSKKEKYHIQGRRQTLVNIDPQRRCYDGRHYNSKLVWTDWYYLGTVYTREEAEESVKSWQEINPGNEYQFITEEV